MLPQVLLTINQKKTESPQTELSVTVNLRRSQKSGSCGLWDLGGKIKAKGEILNPEGILKAQHKALQAMVKLNKGLNCETKKGKGLSQAIYHLTKSAINQNQQSQYSPGRPVHARGMLCILSTIVPWLHT